METITIYDVMEQPGAKEFLDSIGNRSIKSAKTYSVGLLHFEKFLSNKHTLQSVIQAIKVGQNNVYELLNSFVSYLLKLGDKTISTIKIYVGVMRSYFAFYDIDIDNRKFKSKVKVPKIAQEAEQAIDAADIRLILLSCNNRRLKAYIEVLGTGGMRAMEACAIRLMDLDFSVGPTKVHIRKEFCKTRISREVYISDEATKFLNEWINWKYRAKPKHDTDLVFMLKRCDGVFTLYDKMRTEFAKLLEVTGFGARKEGSGLRRKVTLHSLRRFVDGVLSDQVGKDYAEWFLGHKKNTYYTKKEPYRREKYSNCTKYLTFLDYTTLEATGKNVEARLSQREAELQSMRNQIQNLTAALYQAGILKRD